MALHCNSCGKAVKKGAKTCPNCGTAIIRASNRMLDAGGDGSSPAKNASGKSAGALISLSLALVLVAAGIWVLQPSLKSGRGGTPEPIKPPGQNQIAGAQGAPQAPQADTPVANAPAAGSKEGTSEGVPETKPADATGFGDRPLTREEALNLPQSPYPSPCDHLQTVDLITDCWTKQYLAVEAEVNKVYRQLLEKTEEVARPDLVDEQNAWFSKAFADSQAQSDKFKDQPLQPIIGYRTLCKLTKERTKELKARLKAAGKPGQ